MPAKPTPKKIFKTSPEKVEVRESGVHGKGVYAVASIRKGERVIEYTGAHLPWDDAKDLPPRDEEDPYHTFLFSLDNGDVIDAGQGGNDSRWINHSCDPNCETTEEDNRVFVYALRGIRRRRRALLRLPDRAGRAPHEKARAGIRLRLRQREVSRHDAGPARAVKASGSRPLGQRGGDAVEKERRQNAQKHDRGRQHRDGGAL